jgi:hypothetical protein
MNRPPTAPPATRQAGAAPIPDPAAADLLERVRRARRLSCSQMAELIGLQGANGADAVRQMERGARPIAGPLRVLLGLLERGADQLPPRP